MKMCSTSCLGFLYNQHIHVLWRTGLPHVRYICLTNLTMLEATESRFPSTAPTVQVSGESACQKVVQALIIEVQQSTWVSGSGSKSYSMICEGYLFLSLSFSWGCRLWYHSNLRDPVGTRVRIGPYLCIRGGRPRRPYIELNRFSL